MVKVVKSQCDLSEHSGHVTDGFPKIKNIWIGGWVGGLSSIQFFLDFWIFFNFAKPLIQTSLESVTLKPNVSCLSYRNLPYEAELSWAVDISTSPLSFRMADFEANTPQACILRMFNHLRESIILCQIL